MVQESNGPRQKLERKQEGGGKIKRKERTGRNSKAGETKPAMTLGIAEEANLASAGNNRACSDRRDREDKYSSGERIRARDRSSS